MRADLPLWALARSHRRIFVGPFTSELGFEVLYWLPYLDYLCQRYRIDPSRLIVVTRGGAGRWYGAGQSVELYDYVPPGDVRLLAHQGQRENASVKQLRMTAWETRLLALIAERMGVRRYGVLHPSRLYRAFDAFWTTQKEGLAPAFNRLRFRELAVGPPPVGLALPESFVCVRWYQRVTWPLRDELLDWTRAVVAEIAKTTPVVVLTSSVYADDHVDFPAPSGENITVVSAEPWKENLAVQASIIKRASAFVGTWGGMAQLAVRLKVPTAAFFDRWQGISYAHRTLTEFLAMQQGTPCFVGRAMDAEHVRAVLPVAIPVPELGRGSSS